MAKRITFRVSNIPSYLTLATLAAYLAKSVPDLGEPTNIHVRSLAASSDAIRFPPEQTATVEFDDLPERFASPKEHRWPIKVDGSHSLVFDSSFIGFTPLNAIDDDSHVADRPWPSRSPIGLWRQRSEGVTSEQFMWLRDQLPHDQPKLRVMLYGYDTKLHKTQSFQDMHDLAQNFLVSLRAIGATARSARPILLFAHSLGGLLVKQAIVNLAGSGDAWLHILQNIRLVAFFGVPHNGMYIEHLTAMVQGQPNQDLISKLAVNSPFLQSLDEVFRGVILHQSQPTRIISAYETVKSPMPEMTSKGKFERTGAEQVVVTKQSAIHSNSRSFEIFQINMDHSNMIKFCYNDPSYLVIRRVVSDTLEHLQSSAPGGIGHTSGQALGDSFDATKAGPLRNTQKPRMAHNAHSAEGDDVLGLRPTQPPIDLDPVESLRNDELTFRYQAIEKSHEATFAWILDDYNLDFLDWIRRGEGVYWIRGKPASGKSTLFRYLHDNSQFQDMIANQRPRMEQFDVWHFFNVRGSLLAQSREGLLCDILYQLATSSTVLKGVIVPFYGPRIDTHSRRWTMREINNAFADVMDQTLADIHITVFIDALDEFHGLPVEIAGWIRSQIDPRQRPGSRTTMRFCFSSREWDSFVLAFENEPGFQLQRYTKHDIKAYTLSRLHGLCLLESPNDTDRRDLATAILDLIVSRADGVFLWVKLAMDELGLLPASTPIEKIRGVVEALPEDLEEFYKRTLSRILPSDKPRAFVFLELVLRSPYPLTFQELNTAEACSSGSTLAECEELLDQYQVRGHSSSRSAALKNASIWPGPLEGPKTWLRDPEQHIGKRTLWERSNSLDAPNPAPELLNLCGGLLECVEAQKRKLDGLGTHEVTFVQFIHRTVQDFAKKPGFSELLLGASHSLQSENGFTYLLKYRCIIPNEQHMHFKGSTEIDPRDNPDYDVLYLANRHEATLGSPNRKFLSSLPERFFSNRGNDRRTNGYPKAAYNTAFELGVAAGLQYFVSDFLLPSTLLDTKQRHPEILNFLAWNVAQRDIFGSSILGLEDEDLEFFQSTTLTKLLLQKGFSTHHDDRKLNAFEILLTQTGWYPLETTHRREAIGMAETLIEFAEQCLNAPIRDDQPRLHFPLHCAHGDMLAMLFRHGAEPNVQDAKGSTVLDTRIGCPMDLFHVFEQLATTNSLGKDARQKRIDELKLLVLNGVKFTKRGQMVLPFLLRMIRQKLATDAVDFLEEVEILNTDVDVDDVPDYTLITDAQVVDLLSATDSDRFERIAEKLNGFCITKKPRANKKQGFRDRLKKLSLHR